ncbi:MAG: Integrase core domain protein [Actinobacteria bacterium ADurb.BinA094]|nr:MAG: Integrase core domain protein [Actinobacteria bacterium ADurb.BinA094]
MSRPRSAMRKIREILRLSLSEGLSRRQIGAALGMPYTTVADHLRRTQAAGLTWPLPDGITDAELEARLFGPPAACGPRCPMPDFAEVQRELRQPGVTLQLLWMEYKERFPAGYQYSQYCEHYRRWRRRVDVVMRQEHKAGEKLFVDFAGQKLPITCEETGAATGAQLFVAVLGASSYTYAEATPSQELRHWIAAHVHAFAYFGGAPRIVVPDNLASAVTRAHRYEPDVNRTYEEMAAHYGAVVIPARPGRPRDKAKVEVGVQVAERWLLASLRKTVFFTLAEANAAIAERLEWLNRRPFKKLPGSRASLFCELERPALRPLPERPYEYAVWKLATVNIDYHVEVERHYYSVPYQLARSRVEVRITAATIEVYARGRRVASHLRSLRPGRHTTDAAHMPSAHRRYAEWSPARLVRWAEQVGPASGALVTAILESRPHPEQGFRSALGIMRLSRQYGPERLEAAAGRALAVRALSYRSLESILKSGLDRRPLPESTPERRPPRHENIRGSAYYN